MDDDFTPEAIQLTHLMIAYSELFTRLHGSRQAWLYQAGEPLSGMFLSDDEVSVLLGGGSQSLQRARAVFFWAGTKVPTEIDRWYKDKNGNTRSSKHVMNREALAWHVLAVQMLYQHPEYW